MQRYAMGDPSMCELATAALREQLTHDGHCTGRTAGDSPTVTVRSSTTCGDRATVSARVDPPGLIGQPFASVGLQLADQQWSAQSVLPITDSATLTPFRCAPARTGYGG